MSQPLFDILSNRNLTNRKDHAHILFSTRRVDTGTGAFGAKTRELDDRETGPEELKVIRAEWEKRTNATLTKAGSDVRIDMRSYADMAAAGDAPGGLMSQEYLSASTVPCGVTKELPISLCLIMYSNAARFVGKSLFAD